MSEAWKSGLFGCFDDFGICLKGCCFLPCMYGDNVAKLNGGNGCYGARIVAQPTLVY